VTAKSAPQRSILETEQKFGMHNRGRELSGELSLAHFEPHPVESGPNRDHSRNFSRSLAGISALQPRDFSVRLWPLDQGMLGRTIRQSNGRQIRLRCLSDAEALADFTEYFSWMNWLRDTLKMVPS